MNDFTEIGEFQLALRTMRTAAAFTMPWNFSFGDCENKAQLLTQFVDYVLSENASKWRDSRAVPDIRRAKKHLECLLLSTASVSLLQERPDKAAGTT
jgi:hypothetical protein